MADTSQVSNNTVAASRQVYQTVYSEVLKATGNGALAAEKAASAATATLQGQGIIAQLVGLGVSGIADILALFVDQITQVKKSAQPGIHDLIAATLSDALLIDVQAADIPVANGAAGQTAVNAALGGKFLAAIKSFLGTSGPTTGDTAEAAVAAFMGFGMQLAVNTGFLALIGGAVPFEHFDEIKEIGEMLEKSLGLGRLTRQFLAPYLQEYVQKPLVRKLAAQVRQDLPQIQEIVWALHAGWQDATTTNSFLAQHGLSNDFIDQLISKYTPRPDVHEMILAEAYALWDPAQTTSVLKSDGIPDALASLRTTLYRNERKAQLGREYVAEAFAMAKDRFIDSAQFSTIVGQSGLPGDEQQVWLNRIGLWLESEHKRLAKADMLYLYEHGQVTLNDLTAWMTDSGYNSQDQFALTLEFISKAGGVTSKTPEQIAAAAQHLHNEHVAYVKDEFQGAYGRAPSDAELSGWVSLLDTKSRTRGDAKTEIKLNPTPPGS